MKFHYLDKVICTDVFYKSLKNPLMPESLDNPRKYITGTVIHYDSYRLEDNKMSYMVMFEGSDKSIKIFEDMLILACEYKE